MVWKDVGSGAHEDFGIRHGCRQILMWVLNHDDIRGIPLISRVEEVHSSPNALVQP
jgi:hypothetical protein